MDIIRVGVRVKKSNDGRLIARNVEIYDLDTGRHLPALSATMTMDVNSFVSVVTELELSDIEVIDED